MPSDKGQVARHHPQPSSPWLPERLLARLWRARAGRLLHTTDGRRLRVIYPGRPAPGHGPDFRDAVLRLQGDRLRGDVELHSQAKDWVAHGHHRDPAYTSVVLHVVGLGTASTRGPAASIPTVELERERPGRAQGPSDAVVALPHLARLASASQGELSAALRRAGQARYRQRIRRAAELVAQCGVEQTLYAGLLEALGYAENRQPFRTLSERLPVAFVRMAWLAHAPEARASFLGEMLRFAAGWEPTAAPWLQRLDVLPLDPNTWRTAGVRPLNHPRRRLEGATLLIHRHLGPGLAASLAAAVEGGPAQLVEALSVASPNRGASLIGRSRAAETAISVVMPTLSAWARARRDGALEARCLELYSHFPPLQENTITREARRLVVNPKLRGLALDACMQQGLLHLYRRAVA